MGMRSLLALESGLFFRGTSIGRAGSMEGEVVFNTGMCGYQEVLTDPSYQGQIVVMTYPHMGNYGMDPIHDESRRPFVSGFVVRETSPCSSYRKKAELLSDYLRRHGIVGIEGIDTRSLTRHLRERGAMRGLIASGNNLDPRQLVRKAKASPGLIGRDLVKEVSCRRTYPWKEKPARTDRRFKVVTMDFGLKWNILRSLTSRGCKPWVVPANTDAATILKMKPDGILLSNGPGDPAAITYAIETIREILRHNEEAKRPIPLFGICLGHQLLALAMDGKTYKLKYGHRGVNHPVKDLTTHKVEITTQNHGFAVDIDSLRGRDIELTHINLNDQTLEGFRHRHLPAFSVQYHPEATPGPHDSRYLFDRFIGLMKRRSDQSV